MTLSEFPLIVALVCTWTYQAYGQSNGDVRLWNDASRSSDTSEGVVEVYNNGQWWLVCDDNFDENEAAVVCRQLNQLPEVTGKSFYKYANDYFKTGSKDTNYLLSQLNCVGTESNLMSCPKGIAVGTVDNCYWWEHAGVKCIPNLCNPNPCQNGATCDETGAGTQFHGYTCSCTSGWTGQNCEIDINECDPLGPCLFGDCINTPGSFYCNCTAGWEGNLCNLDIDECLIDKDCCYPGRSTCYNAQNKAPYFKQYECVCSADSGFQGDCCTDDIDECADPDKNCCDKGTCVNTENVSPDFNKYTCTCSPGYQGSCCDTDVDECQLGTDKCKVDNTRQCTNTEGSYACYCNTGWEGTYCEEDIDECARGFDRCSSFATTCLNTPGSYNCTCPTGWTGHACDQDVLECGSETVAPTHQCDHGVCVELPGSYSCTCDAGWMSNFCDIDINECLGTHNCDLVYALATCVNNPGSYTCECGPFYTGAFCDVEIDLCEQMTCYNEATCMVSNYVAYCVCASGWTGPTCSENINECLNASLCSPLHGICTDLPGSYTCICDPTESWTGAACTVNINECLTQTALCKTYGTDQCIDIVDGGYTCVCKTGWTGTYCDTPDVYVRLSKGHQGYVEVFKDGIWGLVCPINWDENDAKVVCTYLGYSKSTMKHYSYDRYDNYIVTLTDSSCVGNETEFYDCPNTYNTFGAYCPSELLAGVICENDHMCPTYDTRYYTYDYINIESDGRLASSYYKDETLLLSTHLISKHVKSIGCKVMNFIDGYTMMRRVGLQQTDCTAQIVVRDLMTPDQVRSTFDCQSSTIDMFPSKVILNITKTSDGPWDNYCFELVEMLSALTGGGWEDRRQGVHIRCDRLD